MAPGQGCLVEEAATEMHPRRHLASRCVGYVGGLQGDVGGQAGYFAASVMLTSPSAWRPFPFRISYTRSPIQNTRCLRPKQLSFKASGSGGEAYRTGQTWKL